MKDIHDVIKHAEFGDDRLRGSGVVAGQISAFPIDFAGRPYNTLTLPCERVIGRLTPSVTDRLLIIYGILRRQLFFVVALVYTTVGHGIFYIGDVNNFVLLN